MQDHEFAPKPQRSMLFVWSTRTCCLAISVMVWLNSNIVCEHGRVARLLPCFSTMNRSPLLHFRKGTLRLRGAGIGAAKRSRADAGLGSEEEGPEPPPRHQVRNGVVLCVSDAWRREGGRERGRREGGRGRKMGGRGRDQGRTDRRTESKPSILQKMADSSEESSDSEPPRRSDVSNSYVSRSRDSTLPCKIPNPDSSKPSFAAGFSLLSSFSSPPSPCFAFLSLLSSG
eukprot:3495441-Rhodomonas_salina.1